MQLSHLFCLSALLCASAGVLAQNPPADPLAENLFPPELLVQHGEDIGLTAEQRDFLMTQMQQAQSRFSELHEKVQKEVEALGALLKKQRVDEAAVLAQFDKLLARENAIKRAQVALVLSLKNKLTAEQQAKLQAIKKRYAADPARSEKRPGQPPGRIPEKMKKVQAGVQRWQDDGRDPLPIGELMQGFEPLMNGGKFKEAEELLDKALKLLGGEEKKSEVQSERKSAALVPTPAALGKTPAVLKAEIQSLQPAKVVWRDIPWRRCLLEGLAEARAQKKPVVLWAFINSSPGDERC